MKAIRATNIEWDCMDGSLPKFKGFIVKDSFDAPARVPEMLMKKYGHNVISLNFDEFHIADNMDELLKIGGRELKEKDLYKADRSLSSYGKKCRSGLEGLIAERLRMEFENIPEEKMPTVLNEIVLGYRNVTGKEWRKKSVKELMKCIDMKLKDMTYVNLKDDDEIEEEDEEHEE